ncbi:MAG TPA: hypothetical protein VFX03_01300, partial [Thermomicrobiales bacterium]|nr:hypothetical protein [Thermomicrobiales bacterium]
TDDEAAFELALDPASLGFDDGVAQAQHDYRQAVALADFNLAIGGTQADHDAAVAAAGTVRQAAYDTAYANFATLVMPAMKQQGTSDADAEELDAETIDDENLTDIDSDNAAVDGYQDEESTLYSSEQTSDAVALLSEQISNATGFSSAISSVGNGLRAVPSPWLDAAISSAASSAAEQISAATAAFLQSQSQSNADSTLEISQNDALETKDDAGAQAEHDQDVSDAQSGQAEALAQAAVTDSVFQNLPDTLIAPADGPTPALIADYLFGYEAGDYFDGGFYLGDTTSMFDLGPAAMLEVPLESYTGSVPSFLPDGLGIGGNAPYGSESHPSGYVWFNDWGAAINDVMPWGYVGGGQGAITTADTTGADEILGGGIAPGGVTTFMYLVDKVR